MLAVLAARKSHDFKKSFEVYLADQALSNPARMTQNERYLTWLSDLKEELFEAFSKVQNFDVPRRANAKKNK
jgi:hypothetical protein